jgi:hypothetical protein
MVRIERPDGGLGEAALEGARALGTCFGFEVRSPLPFRYLRGGAGEPLAITAPGPGGPSERDEQVLDWAPPRNPFRARLYTDGATFRLWVEDAGWFSIDPPARTISVPEARDPIRLEERIWGIPALLCFVQRGDLPLHAAAVEIDGRAVLLAAPGRFGKTTLAAAFAAAGHRVLGEDLACVRLGDVASLIPGPAMLRIRTEASPHVEIPGAHATEGSDERIHVALDPERRGDCTPLPLAAAVLLREGDAGTRLERAELGTAMADLWSLSFHLPNDEARARAFGGVADLSSSVAVWDLYRPMRFDSLDETIAAIAALVREEAS